MKYIAFFRGINVGGKNIVKMADLRQLFTDLGFSGTETYIQSGNVIFSSGKKPHSLATLIEQAFEKQFGFQSAVVVRSGAELIDIVGSLPFEEAEIERAQSGNPDVEHIYVYLSNSKIDPENASRSCASYKGEDKYRVADREIYLLCRQSIRDSKLVPLLMNLPEPLTARNIKTMRKIVSML